MLNKILIFWGLVLGGILVVENSVQPIVIVFFSNSNAWFLSIISILICIWIWFWIRGIIMSMKENKDDNLDF